MAAGPRREEGYNRLCISTLFPCGIGYAKTGNDLEEHGPALNPMTKSENEGPKMKVTLIGGVKTNGKIYGRIL